jgi:hypothetical protein
VAGEGEEGGVALALEVIPFPVAPFLGTVIQEPLDGCQLALLQTRLCPRDVQEVAVEGGLGHGVSELDVFLFQPSVVHEGDRSYDK